MVTVTTSLGTPAPVRLKSQIIHGAETAMLFPDVSGGQIDVLAGHFQRCVAEDPLQAEGIPAIYQVPDAESMSAGVGVQLWHAGKFLHPLKHFLDRPMGDGKAIHGQKNAVFILWIGRIGTLLGQIIEQGLPDSARAWLGMLGFRVIIDTHGQVVRLDMPEQAEEFGD